MEHFRNLLSFPRSLSREEVEDEVAESSEKERENGGEGERDGEGKREIDSGGEGENGEEDEYVEVNENAMEKEKLVLATTTSKPPRPPSRSDSNPLTASMSSLTLKSGEKSMDVRENARGAPSMSSFTGASSVRMQRGGMGMGGGGGYGGKAPRWFAGSIVAAVCAFVWDFTMGASVYQVWLSTKTARTRGIPPSIIRDICKRVLGDEIQSLEFAESQSMNFEGNQYIPGTKGLDPKIHIFGDMSIYASSIVFTGPFHKDQSSATRYTLTLLFDTEHSLRLSEMREILEPQHQRLAAVFRGLLCAAGYRKARLEALSEEVQDFVRWLEQVFWSTVSPSLSHPSLSLSLSLSAANGIHSQRSLRGTYVTRGGNEHRQAFPIATPNFGGPKGSLEAYNGPETQHPLPFGAGLHDSVPLLLTDESLNSRRHCDFLAQCMTAHLQSHSCSVVIGSNESMVNAWVQLLVNAFGSQREKALSSAVVQGRDQAIPGLYVQGLLRHTHTSSPGGDDIDTSGSSSHAYADYVPSHTMIRSNYPTAVFDIDRFTAKCPLYMEEWAVVKDKYMEAFHESVQQLRCEKLKEWRRNVSLLKTVKSASPLVVQWLSTILRLPPSLRLGYLQQCLRVLRRHAMALALYLRGVVDANLPTPTSSTSLSLSSSVRMDLFVDTDIAAKYAAGKPVSVLNARDGTDSAPRAGVGNNSGGGNITSTVLGDVPSTGGAINNSTTSMLANAFSESNNSLSSLKAKHRKLMVKKLQQAIGVQSDDDFRIVLAMAEKLQPGTYFLVYGSGDSALLDQYSMLL